MFLAVGRQHERLCFSGLSSSNANEAGAAFFAVKDPATCGQRAACRPQRCSPARARSEDTEEAVSLGETKSRASVAFDRDNFSFVHAADKMRCVGRVEGETLGDESAVRAIVAAIVRCCRSAVAFSASLRLRARQSADRSRGSRSRVVGEVGLQPHRRVVVERCDGFVHATGAGACARKAQRQARMVRAKRQRLAKEIRGGGEVAGLGGLDRLRGEFLTLVTASACARERPASASAIATRRARSCASALSGRDFPSFPPLAKASSCQVC